MSQSQVEMEAANITPPLKNTAALKCIAVLQATPSNQTQDLSALFGRLTNGHFLTLKADGGKVYVAFGTLAGTIDETATGTGVTACWPITDGGELPVRLMGGREVATNIATLCSYNILHFKASATCYLRLYRSSVAQGQGSEQFPVP